MADPHEREEEPYVLVYLAERHASACAGTKKTARVGLFAHMGGACAVTETIAAYGRTNTTAFAWLLAPRGASVQ